MRRVSHRYGTDMARRLRAQQWEHRIVDAVLLHEGGPVVCFDVGFRYERDDRGRLVKTDDEILHSWLSRL